jgi:hypothetical protein
MVALATSIRSYKPNQLIRRENTNQITTKITPMEPVTML